MRKSFILIPMLCLMVTSVLADSREVITISGQTVEKEATRITFSGDNVTLRFTDGNSDSYDMSQVSIAFLHTAMFNGDDEHFDNVEVIKAFGGKTVGVNVRLTLKAKQWTGICLPFDLSEEDLAHAFGQGAKLAVMESATATNINFVTTTELKAGMPYLISVPADMSAFSLDKAAIGTMATGHKVVASYFSHTGTINSVAATGTAYTITNGEVKKVSGTVPPLHTYLTATESDSDLKTFTIDGEPTAGIIGDANGDGRVNVTDVMALVNYILDNHPSPFIYDNANVVVDEKINVSDIMAIVNIILSNN